VELPRESFVPKDYDNDTVCHGQLVFALQQEISDPSSVDGVAPKKIRKSGKTSKAEVNLIF